MTTRRQACWGVVQQVREYSSNVEATATIEPVCAVYGSAMQLARTAQHGGSDVEAPVNALVLPLCTKFVSHLQTSPRVSCISLCLVGARNDSADTHMTTRTSRQVYTLVYESLFASVA